MHLCVYNMIFESWGDGQIENTNFSKPRILTCKSKEVKWCYFLTIFQKCLGGNTVCLGVFVENAFVINFKNVNFGM